jgi:hypothetical protein
LSPALAQPQTLGHGCNPYQETGQGKLWDRPLPGQQLLLGGSELLVAQNAGVMQLRQLLQLGCQVRPGSRWRWRWRILRRRWRILLLLRLRVRHTLLIGGILLLLRSRILLRVLLFLMVVDCTRGPGDYGGGGHDTRGTD